MGTAKTLGRSQRGQTMVEYLMLIVVVMGMLYAFQGLGVPYLNDIFTLNKRETESTAMRGGQTNVINYYAGSEKKVKGR